MKLSPEQVQEILDAAKPDIIKGLKEEVVRQTQWDVTSKAGELVRKEVEAFVAKEIIPEVQALLAEQKTGLVALAIPLAETVMAGLAKSLSEAAQKNLESSYNRGKIFEALFK